MLNLGQIFDKTPRHLIYLQIYHYLYIEFDKVDYK